MAKRPSTGEISPSKTRTEVLKEAERIEESLLFSSKGHFAACRVWTNFHLCIGIPTVLLSAIAGASALSRFDSTHVISGILLIIVAALSAVSTFVNANSRAASHQASGNSYDALMNEVRIFRLIDCWNESASDHELTERVKRYSERKDDLNRKSSAIPYIGYRIAKRGIERGEADYKVDSRSASQSTAGADLPGTN